MPKPRQIFEPVAHIQNTGSHAVVYTAFGTYLLDLSKEKDEPEVAGPGTHIPMFMQGPGHFEIKRPGKPPFQRVYRRMRTEAAKTRKNLERLDALAGQLD